MNITYHYLKEFPKQITPLARAIYAEWNAMYERQGLSVEQVIEKVRERAVDSAIPLTMIALDGDTLLGSITIKEHDFADHPELSPWLAGVFTLPEYRNQGVGKGLITFAETIAKEKFDVKELFLYTGSASKLYEKIGYETFETVDRGDKILTLMKKKLL